MSQVLKVAQLASVTLLLSVLLALVKSLCISGLSHLFHLQGVQTTGLQFRLVDAKEQVVGRLAAQLSVILQARNCRPDIDWHRCA